jgi:hypothetical protein
LVKEVCNVLTSPRNSQLMLTLDQDGYRTK